MSNTSNTDKVVVGGALVGGLLFFGFLTNTCSNPFSKDTVTALPEPSTTSVTTVNPTNSVDDHRIAELQAQHQEQISKLEKNATIARNAEIKELEIESENNYQILNSKIDKKTAQIKALEAQLAVQPTTTALDNTTDNSGKITELENEITKLKALLSDNKTKNEALMAQLSAAAEPSSEEDLIAKVKSLTANVESLDQDNKDLNKEVDTLKEELRIASKTTENDSSPHSQIKQLTGITNAQKAELEKKSIEITKLKAQVNQFNSKKNLFVENANELPTKAKALFTDLKSLEGSKPTQVQDAYERYLSKHSATSRLRIQFASGQSDVNATDKAKMKELTNSAGDNSYFLIVGYADKSGSASSNQKLSSKRSTAVATSLVAEAKGLQSAQAVYLGQTDRFGPASENRVVEVWEIK